MVTTFQGCAGEYVRVLGKTYGARSKGARIAIRDAGLHQAPIDRWTGAEWRQTGSCLYAAESVQEQRETAMAVRVTDGD